MTSAGMRRVLVAVSSLLVGAVLAAQAPIAPHQAAPPAISNVSQPVAMSPAVRANFGHLPLSFEQNVGQTAPVVQWLARGPESTLFLSGNDATVQLNHIEKVKRGNVELERAHSASLRMSLLGAQPARSSAGEDLQTGKANYFTGNNPSHWQKDVPLYSQVRLNEVYPGISLLYHGERGQLEYDFVVGPNADPAPIALGFTGANAKLAANGDLLLPIPGDATVRFDKPIAYQVNNGVRTPVDSSYLVAANGHVSFHLGAYDHTRELIIDPKLVFLGTLGAGNYPHYNDVNQITVDATGAMYFIGTTNDPAFPITVGSYQQVCGPAEGNDASSGGAYCSTGGGSTSAYISKISADGTTLLYSTYLSGHSGYEQGVSIAVDGSGVAYLLGETASNDFPITSDAFQTQCQPESAGVFGPPVKPPVPVCDGYFDGGGTEYTVQGPVYFFAKLSADGSTLVYSSFLGGSYAAYPIATALDASGNWYLFGQTSVAQTSAVYPGPGDVSTIVQFPGVSTTGYQTSSTAYYNIDSNGTSDPESINNAAVLSKFSNDGHTLLYGTFFGDETNGYDFNATSFAVGANGVAFIGGWSNASAIPTTAGSVKTGCTVVASNSYTCTTVDGFVVGLDTTKSGAASLVYSTRIGGAATSQGSNVPAQEVLGLAADSNNDAYLTGYTADATFPVPQSGYINSCNTVIPTNPDNCDAAFVLELNPTGTSILAGTYLLSPVATYENATGYKVLLDSQNRVYLYGISQDARGTFPTVNPTQGIGNGGNALYIATMSPDLTKLFFSTRLGNPSLNGATNVIPVNGLALDPSGNIYFAATTNDQVFTATAGTYATAPAAGTDPHTFFGKLSPVLQPVTSTFSFTPTSTTNQQEVTLTSTEAGVYQTTPAPTGTVAFYIFTSTTTIGNSPTTELCSGPLNGGAGSCTSSSLASLTPGKYQIGVVYSGDAIYNNDTTFTTQTLTINTPGNTGIQLTVPATATLGSSVTLSAGVYESGLQSGYNPTGTVTFLDGGTPIGSALLAANCSFNPPYGSNGCSTASITLSTLSAGTHSITASYPGDNVDASFVSAASTLTITKATPTVTLAGPSSATAGASVTFNATVAGSGSTAPSGTVTFLDGATTLGTGTISSGMASYSTSALSTGSHSITAQYAGDVNYLTGVSSALAITINAPATATLKLATSGSPVTTGTSVTFTATASGASGTPTGTVTFLNGATTLGTGTLNGSGVASYTTSFANAGSYSITASYAGSATYGTATSSAVTQVVTGPAPTVVLASSAAMVSPGFSVTFTATVAGKGSPTPTGTVTFLDGTTTLGTGTISSGTATYTTTTLSTGAHSITASYGGDGNYGAAVSPAFTETIVAESFTVTYTPNPVTITRGNAGTTTMSVTPSVPYAGTLTFGCDGSSDGIGCTFTPSTLTWTASNSTSNQTSVIAIQTTSPHAGVATEGAFGAGTWLGSLAVSFLLLLLGRKRKLGRFAQRLALLAFMVTAGAAMIGLSGCGGGTLTGGTPTGTQTLSVTFNGATNSTPLTIIVQ